MVNEHLKQHNVNSITVDHHYKNRAYCNTFIDGLWNIPDSNFLINRLFSGLSYRLGIDYLRKISVYIPRVDIMELEKIANLEGKKVNENDKLWQQYRKLII